MADWSEVRTGDTVRNKDGKLWRVTKVGRDGSITVERNDKSHTGKPTGEVDIVLRAAHSQAPEYAGEGDGETLLRKHLGATKVAEQESGEPWRVPATFQSHADLRGHIYLLHGEYTDDIKGGGKTALAQLQECHDAHHAARDAGNPKPTNAWLDHYHDKDFRR